MPCHRNLLLFNHEGTAPNMIPKFTTLEIPIYKISMHTRANSEFLQDQLTLALNTYRQPTLQTIWGISFLFRFIKSQLTAWPLFLIFLVYNVALFRATTNQFIYHTNKLLVFGAQHFSETSIIRTSIIRMLGLSARQICHACAKIHG